MSSAQTLSEEEQNMSGYTDTDTQQQPQTSVASEYVGHMEAAMRFAVSTGLVVRICHSISDWSALPHFLLQSNMIYIFTSVTAILNIKLILTRLLQITVLFHIVI
jgi:hypothetical protein